MFNLLKIPIIYLNLTETDPEKLKNEQKPEKDEKTKPEDVEIPERHRTFSTLIIVPDGGVWAKIWWLYSWPIRMVTMCLIPHPRKYRRLYPLTFLLCIVLIGLNSYMVYWMVAIIGFTFGIPETVMGMTLLAGGGCLPEAISCVILIRRGELRVNYLIVSFTGFTNLLSFPR